MTLDPARLQAAYYAESATAYDAEHGQDVEHNRALEVISAFVDATGASSVLDVGTGTGRALRVLADRHPAVRLTGVDPSPELLDVAVSNGISRELVAVGRGEALPFADQSYDVVCECGVLHHVPDPAAVVREMQRVARRAVFISDANRYGHGPFAGRLLKIMLYKTRLWWPLVRVRNSGHRHQVSDSDGVFYSYSVYDNLDLFAGWDSVAIVPTMPPSRLPFASSSLILTTSHLLVCAVRHFPDSNDLWVTP